LDNKNDKVTKCILLDNSKSQYVNTSKCILKLIHLLLTQLPSVKNRRHLLKKATLQVLEPQVPFLEVALVAVRHLIAQIHKHLESELRINVILEVLRRQT